MNTSQNSSAPRLQTRVLLPLITLLVLGMAAIASLLAYFPRTMDESARLELKDRVAVALRVESELLAALAVNYSYAEDTYQQLITEPSKAFDSNSIGEYMKSYLGIGLAAAFGSEGQPTFAFVDGEVHTLDVDELMAAGIDKILAREREQALDYAGNSGLMRYDGRNYLVGVNSFRSQQSEQPGDDAFLVIARQLDQGYIKQIARKYRIPDLRFASGERLPLNLALSLRSVDGNLLQTLTWTDPAQGSAFDAEVLIFIGGVALAMCLLTLLLVQNELSRQQQYSTMLSRIAYLDSLTGIDNRRSFFESGRRDLARCERSGDSVLLLMLDVDHFKTINDEFGHAAGDAVLVELSMCLTRELRGYDIIARIGGEEFAVLVTGLPMDEGVKAAERLRKAVESMHAKGASIARAITISIGVAERHRGEGLDALMERADEALYAAKEGGRNRTVVANS